MAVTVAADVVAVRIDENRSHTSLLLQRSAAERVCRLQGEHPELHVLASYMDRVVAAGAGAVAVASRIAAS